MTTQEISSKEFSVAMVAAPSVEVARSLSNYEWQGNLEESSECLMIIKTQTKHVSELTSFVLSEHPYKVPEVISLKITDGNEAYLKWIEEVTQK